MDCYEIDLKAEFTGILCTMALNMSRHLSAARQNKILLLPELKKVVRNLICCECDSNLEKRQAQKNRRPCKPPCKPTVCPPNKPKPDICNDDQRSSNPRRKFFPPERISVKIKNLRHVKPQSSTILTKRRLSACKGSIEEQSQNSTYVYRQQKGPAPNRRDKC